MRWHTYSRLAPLPQSQVHRSWTWAPEALSFPIPQILSKVRKTSIIPWASTDINQTKSKAYILDGWVIRSTINHPTWKTHKPLTLGRSTFLSRQNLSSYTNTTVSTSGKPSSNRKVAPCLEKTQQPKGVYGTVQKGKARSEIRLSPSALLRPGCAAHQLCNPRGTLEHAQPPPPHSWEFLLIQLSVFEMIFNF